MSGSSLSNLSHILGPPRPTSNPAPNQPHSYPPPHPSASLNNAPTSGPYGTVPASSADITQVPIPIPEIASHSSAPQSSASPANAPNRNHGGPSLYACGDCGRRYSRPEHLQRHVQTHTLGRRFACSVCGKTFARADLKKRHEANHENDPTKKRRRTTSSPTAGRVTHACKACAAARVKCQEDKPCQRCARRGLECVSSEANSAAAMHLMHMSGGVPSATPSVDGNDELSSPPTQHTSSRGDVSLPSHPLPERLISQQAPPLNAVAARLGTSDVTRENAVPENYTARVATGPGVPMATDRLPFTDFLRDVLFEQQYTEPARPTEGQGLAVLDFCDNTSLELSDIDFSILDHWNADGTTEGAINQQKAPEGDKSVDIALMRRNIVDAWVVSPWRWNPTASHNAYDEQTNLPVPNTDIASMLAQVIKKGGNKVVDQKLELSARDRVLALVLPALRPDSLANRIASSFPSVEVMDTLLHLYLNSHATQVSQWIHFPTLKFDEQWPQWIANAAAGGAILAPNPTMRKFGLALQEAIRLIMPTKFEENNTSTANLELIQSIIIGQELGAWSGNRRKMEIAEAHSAIPITMMRYRGKFQRSSYPAILVDPTDEGPVLEHKWRTWLELERWKRLVFHNFIRDAQQSMTSQINPMMSYAELTLPLPAAKELWHAKTAQEWKTAYMEREAGQTKRAPSVGDLMYDLSLLAGTRHRVDVQLSVSIYLHAFWALIMEYRLLCSACRSRSYARSAVGDATMLLTSRHQRLVQDLQNFQAMTADWTEITAQERLVQKLVMMNLYISLDDLQLFAGKEGEDQARRIYPILQQWAESPDARSAVWYAGQVLRFAKRFPTGHLKNFYAVAVHHAALALWTYGVVTRASRRQAASHTEMVYVNEPESMAAQRYISLGQGRPAVRGSRTKDGVPEASIEDPKACMEVAHEVLRSNLANDRNMTPAIVENLCLLIKQLGNAAWAVGLS